MSPEITDDVSNMIGDVPDITDGVPDIGSDVARRHP
jgi:hypothetical protein